MVAVAVTLGRVLVVEDPGCDLAVDEVPGGGAEEQRSALCPGVAHRPPEGEHDDREPVEVSDGVENQAASARSFVAHVDAALSGHQEPSHGRPRRVHV
jgi:hypothetical protein